MDFWSLREVINCNFNNLECVARTAYALILGHNFKHFWAYLKEAELYHFPF